VITASAPLLHGAIARRKHVRRCQNAPCSDAIEDCEAAGIFSNGVSLVEGIPWPTLPASAKMLSSANAGSVGYVNANAGSVGYGIRARAGLSCPGEFGHDCAQLPEKIVPTVPTPKQLT